ncbi:MAG: PPP family 3-phenylpropionic acid transporter [Rhodothermales bacterium]|jgi:PPP family 3-phenylpropionic acid transporter
MGFGIVTPYLQVVLSRLGYSPQEIGIILGMLSVTAVVAPPLWGVLADRRGARFTLLIIAIAAIPAFQLYAICESLAAAIAVTFLFGCFFLPQISLTDGCIFRYLKTNSGNYGNIRVAGSLGFVFTVLLLEAISITGPHVIAISLGGFAVCGVVLAICILRLPRIEQDHELRTPQPFTWKPLLTRAVIVFTLAAFLGRVAMMGYYHFFSLYLEAQFGNTTPGYMWVLGSFCEIPLIWYSDRIIRRIGVRHLFALGLTGIAVRLLGMSIAPSIWWVVPLQVLHALTYGACHCASVHFISRAAPAHMASSAQTIFSAVTIGLGGIVGGVFGGWIAENHGYLTLYRCFGVLAIGALILHLAQRKEIL